MSVLAAKDLSLSFGPRVVFDEVTFTVGPRDRCGLVGPNGSGKSTLLKLLAGQASPDSGEVMVGRGVRVGYLPQEIGQLAAGPLLDTVLATVPGRSGLESRLAEVEAALANSEVADPETQLERAQQLADLHEMLADFDDRFGRHRAAEILEGLGFTTKDFDRPTSELSGGWRMRAALAGLLLQGPDLLLLDEPTNHLDVPSLAWFESFLASTRRALILVTHDREFLERHTSKILALEPEGLRTFDGGFSSYRVHRASEAAQLEARAARQAKKIAETEAFIERFKAKASKARQAKSREKALAKEEVIELHQERERVAFRFPSVERSGRDVLTLDGVTRRFGDRTVHRGVTLTAHRGDRIAIVGVNGAGKTTLLKLMAGELQPDEGTVTLGHNVRLSYYAQHHTERLDRNSTILEELAALVPDQPQSRVRGVLGSFLFSGDDVDKKIAVLSGGERARVALAKLLVIPANLMLMDEPTNHLDLDSSEALIEALEGYEGTLIFVSHTRSFVNRLATKVWDVSPDGVTEWPGNLDDYLRHRELEKEAALASSASTASSTSSTSTGNASTQGATPSTSTAPSGSRDKERRRLEAQERQARSAREKPLRDELARLESRIAECEAAVAAAEEALADPTIHADFNRARPHIDAQSAGQEELERLYAAWEEVGAKLEAMG